MSYDPEATPTARPETVIDVAGGLILALDRDPSGQREGMGIGNEWNRWAGFVFVRETGNVALLTELADRQWLTRAANSPRGDYPHSTGVPAVTVIDCTPAGDSRPEPRAVDLYNYQDRAIRFGVDLHARIAQALAGELRTVYVAGDEAPVRELIAVAEEQQILG